MLADHRLVSRAAPIDRRVRRLIAKVIVTQQAFVFQIRERHNNRPPSIN
jgi:hypothetical protein